MTLFSSKNKKEKPDGLILQGKVFLRIFLTKDKGPSDYPLLPGEYTIGRGSECKIVIPSQDEFLGVTQYHATVKVKDDEISIEDHSKGGTYRLKKRKSEKGFEKINKETLEIGDRLKFDVVEAEIYSSNMPPSHLTPPTEEITVEVSETFTTRTEKAKRYIISEAIAEGEVQLFYEETIIGRDPDKCSIIIDNKYDLVSREHAKIIIKDTVCYFEDIGSRNGSYIRTTYGEFVKLGANVPVPLHDNTMLRLGGRDPRINGKKTCDIRYVEEQ